MISVGIEANPDKVQAVSNMKSTMIVKEIQKSTGYIAALGRFISSSMDKCLPFFKVLKEKV